MVISDIGRALAAYAATGWGEDGFGVWYVEDLDKLCVWFNQSDHPESDVNRLNSIVIEDLEIAGAERETNFIVLGRGFAIVLNDQHGRWAELSEVVEQTIRGHCDRRLNKSDAVISYEKDVQRHLRKDTGT